jgi:glutamate racemase
MGRNQAIGIFDSGYGGLTVLKSIRHELPQYDYVYLGDNARTPYGTRSYDVVYEYTLEAVKKLFAMNCRLVILACNTASAKALRTIQQTDLPSIDPQKRVLGVIRPSVEEIMHITRNNHVGIVGTPGTVNSQSYVIEIDKISNQKVSVAQQACPMWVPIVENNEIETCGADFFIKKDIESLLKTDSQIDTLVLGCTHYPLLIDSIKKYLPQNITIVDQGPVVARKLADYLKRHVELEKHCSQGGTIRYYTTENALSFNDKASLFLCEDIRSQTIHI